MKGKAHLYCDSVHFLKLVFIFRAFCMFSCSPSSPCEPYPLPLPLTVIQPRSPCTFATGVSAILQHSYPAFPAHSYSVKPCLHFPACNQPWLWHTAADQFFSFNPTIVPNLHTHTYTTHILNAEVPGTTISPCS